MKKPVSAIVVLMLTAASAAASGSLNAAPGDPKKDKSSATTVSKPETSFSFSSGYFSFFNLFVSETAAPDSSRTSTSKSAVTGKSQASKQEEE